MNLNVNSINIILISILSFLFTSVFPASVLAGSHIGVRDKILNEIKKYDAKVGVAVIFNGEDTLVVNNEDKYPLMSVFKFHQALAVGNYLQSKGIGYDSVVYVSKDELKENTYSPLRDKYPEGNLNISIADLLAYTIQMSDNNACDILFDKIVSVDSTDKYIRSAGIKDFLIEYNEDDMHTDLYNCYKNWSTPLAAVQLLELFINGKTVTGAYQDYICRLMTECTTGTARLPFPLKGTNAIIGHKTGTGDKNKFQRYIGINDIGFVKLPDGKRYVIAVFVKDSAESFDDTERIIANISSIVYDSVNMK